MICVCTITSHSTQDLDGTKAANKALQVELASLAADKAHLQQQCDNRSAHALTLISENKRLSQQVCCVCLCLCVVVFA